MAKDLDVEKELKAYLVDQNIREETERYRLRLEFEKELHKLRMEEIVAVGGLPPQKAILAEKYLKE